MLEDGQLLLYGAVLCESNKGAVCHTVSGTSDAQEEESIMAASKSRASQRSMNRLSVAAKVGGVRYSWLRWTGYR